MPTATEKSPVFSAVNQTPTSTQKLQSQLATFCRDPSSPPIESLNVDRSAVYRRLLMNNIKNTLDIVFPIAHEKLETQSWDKLVQCFFAQKNCNSPYLWKMPYSFYEFVRDNHYSQKLNLPYLEELLLYEWNEVEVFMMKNRHPKPFVSSSNKDDLMKKAPVINPEFILQKLHYPVFKKELSDFEKHLGEYFILTYRHPQTLEVCFFEFSKFFTLIFEIINHEPTPIQEALVLALDAFNKKHSEEIEAHTRSWAQALCDEKVILGFNP